MFYICQVNMSDMMIWYFSQCTYTEIYIYIYIYIYTARNKAKMMWMKEYEVKNKERWIYRTRLLSSMCKECRCHRLKIATAPKCLITFDLLTLSTCLRNSREAEFLCLSVISHMSCLGSQELCGERDYVITFCSIHSFRKCGFLNA